MERDCFHPSTSSMGQVEVRMREKVFLGLSELGTKEECIAEAAEGALNFGIPCSVRI